MPSIWHWALHMFALWKSSVLLGIISACFAVDKHLAILLHTWSHAWPPSTEWVLNKLYLNDEKLVPTRSKEFLSHSMTTGQQPCHESWISRTPSFWRRSCRTLSWGNGVEWWYLFLSFDCWHLSYRYIGNHFYWETIVSGTKIEPTL